MRKTSTVVLSLLVCLGVAFGDLLICKKCGYENKPGDRECIHCKAVLPASVGAEGDGDGQDAGGAVRKGSGFLDRRVVEAEMALGDRYRKSGKFALARLVYRNAAALDMLTDPAEGNKRSTRIVESMKKSRSLTKSFKRKCQVCNGTGKAMMLSQDFDGNTTYREVAGRGCRSCYGTGSAMGVGTVAERTAELGRSVGEYVQLQKARKFAPVGEAWIPMSLEGALSHREKALLMRTVAAPCRRCMGLARADCGNCKGTGIVPCRARGCVRGMVESEIRGGLMKMGIKRRIKCRTCAGKGAVACETCRGQGNVICGECKGMGERPPCTKCTGQGTVACRRCKGTGSANGEDCAECRAGGVILCGTCNGDGRMR